ncbi:hypothetical protein FRC11_006220, partial [Ceratobasidium sp. 423]
MPLESFGDPAVDAEGRLPALEDHCTLLQWITFSWVSPLVALGSRQPLGEKDMWQLSRFMRTRVLMKQFSQLKRSSLLRRILAANARDLFLDLILTVLSAILDFGPPVFLNLILRAMTAGSPDDSVFSPPKLDDSRFYTSLSVKTLLLRSPDSTATETQRPLQRRDAYVFAFAAALCQLIKSQSDLQHLYFARRASVRIKGELVASIYEKALKRKDMSGAVKQPSAKSNSAPGAKPSSQPEESSSADIGKVVSLIAADAEWISRFVTLGTFIYDAPVSAVISCFLLYNLMGWTAFVGYIALILTLPINNFLAAEAPKPQQPSRWAKFLTMLRLRKKVNPPEAQETTSTEEDQPFTLCDVSVVFPEGVLTLVYGPTGSGKSSLLSAILGEMDRFEGESYLPKDPTRLNSKTSLQMATSYCAQQPWLEHKSIKENILFGSPFDQERYKATLDACGLRPDLALFEDGDETEIGEKGVSLSGGQKARVALARAVYARTQFVILDDVLSAVDTHTAEHIVQRCLRGPLLRNRTVVLVTHH